MRRSRGNDDKIVDPALEDFPVEIRNDAGRIIVLAGLALVAIGGTGLV